MTAAVPPLPGFDGVLAQAGSENFPVAARFLPAQLRSDLMAIYGYARFVDDIGDDNALEPAGKLELLNLVDADVTRLFAGDQPQLPAVEAFVGARDAGWLPEEPLRRLIEANRLDQRASCYQTFDDLRAYCTLSADPVGRLVLAAIGIATPERVALSDQVCTALQLAEHWQDVAEDRARGRVYLPQEDLRRFGVSDADLLAEHAGPALRELLAFEVARAMALLNAGAPLVRLVPGRPRLAIAGFVAGGRAALQAIADAEFDVLAGPPKASKPRVLRSAVRVLASRAKPGEPKAGPGESKAGPDGPAAAPVAPDVAAAYAECDRIMVDAAKNFSYGIKLLAPEKRGALAAVYAFARRIDDIGDGDLPDDEKLRLLEEARHDIKAIGEPTSDPVLLALGDAASRLPIPVTAFLELVDGCELDVRGARYESFPDLVHYCRCVAGSIGRLSTGVFEPSDPIAAGPLADALGVALQLTNILRDVREDLNNGRVYLPQDELDAAGVTLRLDDNGNIADSDGRVAALIREQTTRAEKWYADGLQLLPLLDARSAACCAAMSGIYHRLLKRIADDPDLVLRQRISLPKWDKAYLAARSLATSRR
ncbi:MAG: 15-cis-phytoene synthase [Actinomycetota bacterium]|nr:15-cis-phytoene synthase [Actinomycetota bacterium]